MMEIRRAYIITCIPNKVSIEVGLKLQELRMTYTYNEIPGGDYGSVILGGNPGVYAFFSNHSKPASH